VSIKSVGWSVSSQLVCQYKFCQYKFGWLVSINSVSIKLVGRSVSIKSVGQSIGHFYSLFLFSVGEKSKSIVVRWDISAKKVSNECISNHKLIFKAR